ncbi:MAG: nucleotide exchange factor GrpE [Patescibacteria group bacterium]|nr:nucleotide exchange factor GrpE [Patescibacteria group bacterium]MBU2508824.1 nucleotide exchange factor GrpE [Patescibacteria group bacterium]
MKDDEINEIESLKAQSDEYLAGWKRAKADYENLQKETEKKISGVRDYASENILTVILPIIDHFELALEHTPNISSCSPEDQKQLKNWITGLHAVRALWETVFNEMGLEVVDASGEFNPEIHEAIAEEENEDVAAGKIIRIEQNGYKLKDKLIRPAKVVLSKE